MYCALTAYYPFPVAIHC